MSTEEITVDVLVVGTGASGMSAAVTAAFHGLEVLVVEKEARYGGTTARSGGWLWIPGTRLATEQGIQEPPGAAKTYLRHEATTHFDEKRVDAFLENGPKAIDFFTQNTCVQFDMPAVFPDYHAEEYGGQPGGRSMVTRPFDGRELGQRIKDLAPPLPELTVFGMMLGSGPEIRHFMRAFKSLGSFIYVTKRLSRHFLDVVRYGRGLTLTNGNALAGRLAKAAMDQNIPVWLSSPVTQIMTEYDGVTGATVEHDGKPVLIHAKQGVVLACGGFPHDIERRKQLFPHAPTGHEHFSPSPAGNTGDGLRLAEAVGGRVDGTIPNAAAWVPASVTTRKDGSKGVMPHFIDRAKPGVIAVTPQGKRFTNEGNSYHDFVQDMVKTCKNRTEAGSEITAWLLCDHKALRNYGLGCVAPAPLPIGRHLRSGYLKRGRTVAALAEQIGIDPQTLETTINAFNATAKNGEDPAFGKGSKAYNRYQGDAAMQPNPCVAPLEHAPFYAIKLVIGDIGTFAGLVTDANTHVLNDEGKPIKGLFAVGNDAASIMGGNYPGAGITLGPALTFGYVAAMQCVKATASMTISTPLEQREPVAIQRRA